MYQGVLATISNRADWFGDIELINDDTGDVITDLTGVEVKIAVRPVGHGWPVLKGSIEDGTVSIVGAGVLEWHFTAAQMAAVCPGTYDVGITVSRDDITEQELVASLPVIDGVVRS